MRFISLIIIKLYFERSRYMKTTSKKKTECCLVFKLCANKIQCRHRFDSGANSQAKDLKTINCLPLLSKIALSPIHRISRYRLENLVVRLIPFRSPLLRKFVIQHRTVQFVHSVLIHYIYTFLWESSSNVNFHYYKFYSLTFLKVKAFALVKIFNIWQEKFRII